MKKQSCATAMRESKGMKSALKKKKLVKSKEAMGGKMANMAPSHSLAQSIGLKKAKKRG